MEVLVKVDVAVNVSVEVEVYVDVLVKVIVMVIVVVPVVVDVAFSAKTRTLKRMTVDERLKPCNMLAGAFIHPRLTQALLGES